MDKHNCFNCKFNGFSEQKPPCLYCSVLGRGFVSQWRSNDPNYYEEKEPKTRADFLKEVEGIICKDRNEQYGEPEDNFKRIAVFWSNYLDREITSADVAIMMVLFKAARIATGHNKEDNWVDIAGYSLCGAECAVREK